MPKPGFRSITITKTIYDRFHTIYQNQKEELEMKGISSFTGFITFKLYEILKEEK